MRSQRRIQYMDSQILHSLDHVRALYYPSYDPSEIVIKRKQVHVGIYAEERSVTLNVTKATKVRVARGSQRTS